MNKLLPNIRDKLVLDIKFQANLRKQYGDEAYVIPHETQYNFTIVTDSCMSRLKMLKTFSHECVHIKQLSLNEFSITEQDNIWFGKPIDPDLDYWEQPHEIEALGRSVGLYKGYMELLKYERYNIKRIDSPLKLAYYEYTSP